LSGGSPDDDEEGRPVFWTSSNFAKFSCSTIARFFFDKVDFGVITIGSGCDFVEDFSRFECF
jgi:hypothetical protein